MVLCRSDGIPEEPEEALVRLKACIIHRSLKKRTKNRFTVIETFHGIFSEGVFPPLRAKFFHQSVKAMDKTFIPSSWDTEDSEFQRYARSPSVLVSKDVHAEQIA
jgi:hypothetical protein